MHNRYAAFLLPSCCPCDHLAPNLPCKPQTTPDGVWGNPRVQRWDESADRLGFDAEHLRIAEHDWNVFGTLNFAPGHKVTGDESKRLWRRFWNKADRLAYGTSCSYGYRIERAVFTQYGALGDNAHIHFLAKSPIEPAKFCTSM
jgi:hypothetical protein